MHKKSRTPRARYIGLDDATAVVDAIRVRMHDQRDVSDKGGTQRLGAYYAILEADSIVHRAYGEPVVSERHRHRYEFNNKYLEQMEEAGLKATGVNPESNLVEIVELKDHPWFVGVQFHPVRIFVDDGVVIVDISIF